MNTRKNSRQQANRRQLRLESLETRCLLALTAVCGVDAEVTCEGPGPESDLVTVAGVMPADDAMEMTSDCGCSPEALQDIGSEVAAGYESLECVGDDLIAMIDLAFVSDDPTPYMFDITMVERALSENIELMEETPLDLADEILTFAVEPQMEVDDVGDEDSEDGSRGEKPTDQDETASPVIYYIGPMIETNVELEAKPVEVAVSPGPIILRPTFEDSGFDVPQDGHEEPSIYTFGGSASATNDSQSTYTNSNSDAVEREASGSLTRQHRREFRVERRAEQARARQERDLLTIVNGQRNDLLFTNVPATTSVNESTGSNDNSVSSPGGGTEPALNLPTVKRRDRRSVGR